MQTVNEVTFSGVAAAASAVDRVEGTTGQACQGTAQYAEGQEAPSGLARLLFRICVLAGGCKRF